MRGLYSIHDVANSSVNIWSSKGFVAFLLCTKSHEAYITTLREQWITFDAIMGESLWTVVSFVPERAESEEEIRLHIKSIRNAGIRFEDTPCLLFSYAEDSEEYFVHRLKGHRDSQSVGEEFHQIVDACIKQAPKNGSGPSEGQFQSLKQELRVIQHAEAVSRVSGIAGGALMDILKKLFLAAV